MELSKNGTLAESIALSKFLMFVRYKEGKASKSYSWTKYRSRDNLRPGLKLPKWQSFVFQTLYHWLNWSKPPIIYQQVQKTLIDLVIKDLVLTFVITRFTLKAGIPYPGRSIVFYKVKLPL